MKKKAWFWMFISFVIVITIFAGWEKFRIFNASSEILSKKEAQNLMQDRYQGKVIQIKLTNKQYHIEFEKQGNIYNVRLDSVSGQVLSFTRIVSKALQFDNQPTKFPSESPPSTPQSDPSKKLTELDAEQIAKNQVNGTIKHISAETSEEGTYYLVELETQDGQEAVVQIHAITGKVMAVSWDDQKNNNHQKDDDSKDRTKDDN